MFCTSVFRLVSALNLSIMSFALSFLKDRISTVQALFKRSIFVLDRSFHSKKVQTCASELVGFVSVQKKVTVNTTWVNHNAPPNIGVWFFCNQVLLRTPLLNALEV